MSKLPKLLVKRPRHYPYPLTEVCSLEQAQHFLFDPGLIVIVEGQATNSYEELVQLASQDHHKDKEFLEVWVYAAAGGG